MKRIHPLVTVIIPVYNGEKYITDCIQNMLNQSYGNLEILIINDGSSDNTAKLAEKFPVTIINFDQNQGLSVARNTGIDAAKGDYIHFMDVDDEINLDFYKEMVEAILVTESDIACCGMINELKPHRTVIFSKQEVFTNINDKLKSTNVGRWGFSVRYLIKKEMLNRHSIRFEKGRFVEDLPFSLAAVYYSQKIVLVKNAVYTYKLQENSIMTNNNREHKRKRRVDLNHMKEVRHKFANEHNIKIPGIPTTGLLSLFFVKYFK
jgi:glycosyltransferase involved in cell wall biosynthesis